QPQYLPSVPTRRSSDLIEPSSFFNPQSRKPRIAPPNPSETGTIRRYARNTGSCSAVCGEIIAHHLEAQSRFVSSERLPFVNSLRDRKSTRLNSSHQIIS